MDFLDPRKRRAHKIRLIIGYILVAIAIGLGTLILVYGASGYGVNKKGQIIQNGLLFVDSKPGGSQIYLNGNNWNAVTSARLVIPAGDYTLTLKKSGYQDWQRSFTLQEGSIDRFVYPFLYPQKFRTTSLVGYASQPSLITESPSQRWLLVQKPDDAKQVTFDQFDLNALANKETQTPTQVSIPDGILSGGEGSKAQLKMVEWSTDNNNVLLEHDYNGSKEFIVFDRAKPDQSFNVNKTFNVNPDEVALRNKKVDFLYLYDRSAQAVQLGDVGKDTLAEPMLKQVLAFKPYGTDLMTYVTDKGMPSGEVQARIWNNGQTYPLYTFKAGSTYLIDAAQYSGHWYYVAGSDTDKRVNVYQDPLSDINNKSIGKAIPILALNVDGATKVGFSNNARFVEVENGQSFGVYDMETKDNYQYRLTAPLAAPLSWMDGHRLIGESDGKVFVTDYDSTNQHTLVPTVDPSGGLFSNDYNHLITLQTKSDGTLNLVNVDMRAGTDLPKQ